MARPKRTPECHPEREHQAGGQCEACYRRDQARAYYAAHREEWRAYNRAKQREYYARRATA